MSYRFVAFVLLGLALSGCDLLKATDTREIPALASATASFGTFEPIGTVSTSGPSPGGAGLRSNVPLDTAPASPTTAPSTAPTFPASFTPTAAPTTAPTTAPTAPATTTPPSPSASAAAVTLTEFLPVSGRVGTSVTISGSNLATVTVVLFGDVATAPTRVTSTQVVAIVPSGAVTSRISLVAPSGVVRSAQFFEIVSPTPTPTCPIRQQCIPPPTG